MTEIVDTASAAATEALKPGPEAVAATTNEQVYMPEATDAATTPAPLFTRKEARPCPYESQQESCGSKGQEDSVPSEEDCQTRCQGTEEGRKDSRSQKIN
ncbi:hypothetical protein ACVWXL_008076 [Bradyrhizobium sp. GM22.5]